MKKSIIIIVISFLMFEINFNIFAQTGKPQYQIRTERADTVLGVITIELFPAIAPLHSAYFDSLVNISFFDSTAFHRVVPDFVIQGGDPNSINGLKETWGEGDPNQATILAEFSGVSHQPGIIGAARDEDINSASSQFYFNLNDNSFLDSNYTAFGQVLEGMDVLDFIENVPRDANDNPNEKIEMFITKGGFTNDVPVTPTLTLPSNGKVGILNLDSLQWEKVNGAVMYYLQISKNISFDSIAFEHQVGSNFYQLKNLELGNVNYYWKVSANNGGNISEFSEVRHFVSSIEPAILVYPEMNQDSISITPEFRWLPVDGATKYRLQLSRSPLFQEQYIVYDVDTITLTYHTPPPLQPKKSHYWRVFSMTDEYQGPKSEFRRFVTPDITGVDDNFDLPTEFSLSQNYPNPFNPSTTINYEIPRIKIPHTRGKRSVFANVTLKIYNTLGKEVITLVNKEHQPGKYSVDFDASFLSSGVYYYKIMTDSFVETKKLILLR